MICKELDPNPRKQLGITLPKKTWKEAKITNKSDDQ